MAAHAFPSLVSMCWLLVHLLHAQQEELIFQWSGDSSFNSYFTVTNNGWGITNSVCSSLNGDWCYQFQGGAEVWFSLPLTGYHSARILIDVSQSGLDNNEWCYVSYKVDGQLRQYVYMITQWSLAQQDYEIIVPDNANWNNQASFQIWFGNAADWTDDFCFFDNLMVYAVPYTPHPTTAPTNIPTRTTSNPTKQPTKQPTWSPSTHPSKSPTTDPSVSPSRVPSTSPTQPSASPSIDPTQSPSKSPSKSPANSPTNNPTKNPSTPAPILQIESNPTEAPTLTPITDNNQDNQGDDTDNDADDGNQADNDDDNQAAEASAGNTDAFQTQMKTMLVFAGIGGSVFLVCVVICICFVFKKKQSDGKVLEHQTSEQVNVANENKKQNDRKKPISVEMAEGQQAKTNQVHNGDDDEEEVVISMNATSGRANLRDIAQKRNEPKYGQNAAANKMSHARDINDAGQDSDDDVVISGDRAVTTGGVLADMVLSAEDNDSDDGHDMHDDGNDSDDEVVISADAVTTGGVTGVGAKQRNDPNRSRSNEEDGSSDDDVVAGMQIGTRY